MYRNPQAGEKVVVDVTHKTIEIAGVRCRIVHDVGSDLESGEVIEDTDDFMAQDLQGNVWYFGEVSRSYEDGLLVRPGGVVACRRRWRETRDPDEGGAAGR